MRRTKKWLAGLLAVVMTLCAMPMALAEDWENTTDVKSYDELTAALLDDKVEEIKIAGEVTIPATDKALELNKPVIIGEDAAFKLAPGAIVTSNVPQGKFWFEDSENTWALVGKSMEAFLLFTLEDGGNYRIMYGTQPDINKVMENKDLGALNTLCFNGADLELTADFDGAVLDVRGGRSLTLAKDVSVKADSHFNLEGSLTMAAGAALEVPDGSDVDGDAIFASEGQMPENLRVGGEVKVSAPEEQPGETPEPSEETPETPETPDETPVAENPFTDVAEDSPFYNAILWAVDQKITAGKTATTFAPRENCSVAQIITFLWRAKGEPEAANEAIAAEISENSYFFTAAQWAAEMGMIENAEGLADPCTRAMAMTFIWKAEGSGEAGEKAEFTDVEADAAYAPAVAWAVEKGITNGTNTEGTLFSPDQVCTRGQIVTFLFRGLAETEAE